MMLLCFSMFACAPTPAATSNSTPLNTGQEMDAVIQQARASLDTFTSALTTPHADRTFAAVKVRFYPPDGSPQDIWVDEVTYTDGMFRGNMGDDIPSLKLEAGEEITAAEKDILDWMIVEDGKLIGGYTIRLAVQRMSPEERERFLKTLDYSIED